MAFLGSPNFFSRYVDRILCVKAQLCQLSLAKFQSCFGCPRTITYFHIKYSNVCKTAYSTYFFLTKIPFIVYLLLFTCCQPAWIACRTFEFRQTQIMMGNCREYTSLVRVPVESIAELESADTSPYLPRSREF